MICSLRVANETNGVLFNTEAKKDFCLLSKMHCIMTVENGHTCMSLLIYLKIKTLVSCDSVLIFLLIISR